jgi:hypothetical protein
MGTDYNHEIGYETLQKDFKRYQKETPRGVSLQNKRNKTIVLKFKISGEEKSKGCNCSFTLDGMVDALSKAKKVAEKLKTCSSIIEFDKWYDEAILEKGKIIDDRMTFGEAIAKVEDDFWSRPSRTKRKRDRENPSDLNSWYDTYARFYKHLPNTRSINIADLQMVTSKWKRGTKTYKGAVSAMKKMASINHRQDIYDGLNELDTSQTEYRELQSITLGEFLNWRDKVLNLKLCQHPNTNIETRKAWLWVFSMQVVYGLRIHEVFAVANAFEPFVTKDKVTIPALSDQENAENILVLQGETLIGTTTKTGYRLARPQIPPKYPDLIERLEIKNPSIPTNKPRSSTAKALVNFYNKCGYDRLNRWNAPTTETHAFRHLANINGMQAGIPLEIRAQSMGHTPAMNDSVYKKRQSTQTTLDLYNNSNQNAIDFVSALAESKKLVKTYPEHKDFAAQLLSIIYQKNHSEISNLLV